MSALDETVEIQAVDPAGTPPAVDTGSTSAGAPFRPSPAGWVARGAVLLAVALVVVAFPLSQPAPDVQIFTQAVIYAVIGLSLNVLLGYAGQISLGHQAFVGIGAFASAYMVSVQGQSFWVGLVIAMAVGALQALVLGGVSLRVTGLYFALVTLSYGLLAEQTLFGIERFTGGGAGQPAPKPAGFTTDHRYYYLCLAILAVVVFVDWRMMRTKAGRALLALRENPRVAAAYGINVKLHTLLAFVVAGVFAGLGGAMLAHNDTFVQANIFDFRLALVFVLMTVVGGLRSRTGVVIGSAFFALLGYLIEREYVFPITGWHLHLEDLLAKIPLVPDLTKEVAPLVLGPILLLVTITLYPGGIGQQLRPLTTWLRGGRFDPHDRGPKEVMVVDVRA